MSARDDILARIRIANGGTAEVEPQRDYRRTGALGRDAVLDLLEDRLVDYRASVHRSTPDSVRDTIAGLLGEQSVVVPAGPPAGWCPQGRVDDGTLTARELDRIDAVVTTASVACAVTGTIVLSAGPGEGRRILSLVPDHHVCVVQEAQVVESVPEMVERLDPTRPLTFVSGPSATSDIELERVEGVHGPRTLDVVLVTPAD